MRTVVSSAEVTHLWAHQTQANARNSNRSLYFEGATIYSYGGHFPIASFVSNARGQQCILLTTRTYGVTTAKHIGMTARAIPGSRTVFHVPLTAQYGRWQGTDFIESYRDRIMEKIKYVATRRASRIKDWGFSQLTELVDEANAFAEFWDLADRFEVPSDFDGIRAEISRIRAEERKREAERQRKIEADNAETVAQWIAGSNVSFPWRIERVYLRIEGDEVVTSKGARVPKAHAIRGLAMVRRVRESGQEYRSNGHSLHLGHYVIDRIDVSGDLHAGCHHVTFEEIERIAPMLEAS